MGCRTWPQGIGTGGSISVLFNLSNTPAPTQELVLFADRQRQAWEVRRRVTLDPQNADFAFEGTTSLGVTASLGASYRLELAEPVLGFCYWLHLAFHPGDATGSAFTVSFKDAEGFNLQDIELVGGKAEGLVALENKTWQVVEVPLTFSKGIHAISFDGFLSGTYYLDDIRLMPEELPPTDTAVLERRQGTEATGFSLAQNHPNPFNSGTVIRFDLVESQWTTLAIYNLAGQRVATLADGFLQPGTYSTTWGRPQRPRSGNRLRRIPVSPPGWCTSRVAQAIIVAINSPAATPIRLQPRQHRQQPPPNSPPSSARSPPASRFVQRLTLRYVQATVFPRHRFIAPLTTTATARRGHGRQSQLAARPDQRQRRLARTPDRKLGSGLSCPRGRQRGCIPMVKACPLGAPSRGHCLSTEPSAGAAKTL